MRNPREILDDRFSRAVDIPPERPDLLQAASRKRYKIAAACGVFTLANSVAATKNYVPAEIRIETHIANQVAVIGGGAATIWNGMVGFFHRFVADEISFRALDQQINEQDETSDPPPDFQS